MSRYEDSVMILDDDTEALVNKFYTLARKSAQDMLDYPLKGTAADQDERLFKLEKRLESYLRVMTILAEMDNLASIIEVDDVRVMSKSGLERMNEIWAQPKQVFWHAPTASGEIDNADGLLILNLGYNFMLKPDEPSYYVSVQNLYMAESLADNHDDKGYWRQIVDLVKEHAAIKLTLRPGAE